MSTQPTDAELKALLLDKLPASKHYIRPVIEKMVAAMQAAIDKWGAPAQAAEPVAWLDPWAGTKVTTDYDAYGKHGIPLYTAQQPTQAQAGAEPTQAQAGAEPLSDEQIQDLLLCGDPTDEEMRLIRIGWDAAHASKGGQHDR